MTNSVVDTDYGVGASARAAASEPSIAALRLSIVVPTYNECENVRELVRRLEVSLGARGWEVVFVDDDSPDGTAALLREIAVSDTRVRCLQRIGRRGLSSACIEGMLAGAAPFLAVMDADLQHDEAILPEMLAEMERGADVVIGTRYAAGGSTGEWDRQRKAMSRIATAASHVVVPPSVSDPMSGFFVVHRRVLDDTVRRLSGFGFKILFDILATTRDRRLRIAEVPYRFRDRHAGDSKLDGMVVWEYGMLLADKTIGRWIPVQFLSFALVGGFGVAVHFAVLTVGMELVRAPFAVAQSAATGMAMVVNFALNNLLTYRRMRLRGWAWIRGLLSFAVACSIGAIGNVGVANYVFERRGEWWLAGIAGVLVGSVWNFAATRRYTWGGRSQ